MVEASGHVHNNLVFLDRYPLNVVGPEKPGFVVVVVKAGKGASPLPGL